MGLRSGDDVVLFQSGRTVKILIDWSSVGSYVQHQEKPGFFINVTTLLLQLGLVGAMRGPFR